MNNDGDVEAFRKLQETFLGSVGQTLGMPTSSVPVALKSTAPEPSAEFWQDFGCGCRV
jgi:hypothetical protein